MANDIFTAKINLLDKTAVFFGQLSYQNTFDVTLYNIGDATITDLALQILFEGVEMGAIAVGDFSDDGSGNATGVLDLDTVNLGTYFSGRSDQTECRFTIVVQETVKQDMLLNTVVDILNNPYIG